MADDPSNHEPTLAAGDFSSWMGEMECALRGDGAVIVLLRLLERRFGALPGWAKDRIATADSVALEEWGLRVLDAGSLDDILA